MKASELAKTLDEQIAHLQSIRNELPEFANKNDNLDVLLVVDEGGYTDPYSVVTFKFHLELVDVDEGEKPTKYVGVVLTCQPKDN